MATYPLNNVATSDNYSEAATCIFPTDRPSISLGVYNAAIYFRITTKKNGVAQGQRQEVFLSPGQGVLEAGYDWPPDELAYKLELRSAVAGVPAQVRAN